jgi:hypothetical protein
MVNSVRRRLVGGVLVAALSAVVLPLSACKPVAAAPVVPARPSFRTPPVGKGSGGAGSLTVSVTKPVAVSGHVDTTVSCVKAGRAYTASADSALVAGYRVAFTVRVAPYHGPGTYPAALVSLTLAGPTGTVGAASVPSPATVTDAGGSFTLDTTTSTGQTFTASLTWACS